MRHAKSQGSLLESGGRGGTPHAGGNRAALPAPAWADTAMGLKGLHEAGAQQDDMFLGG